MCNFKLTSNGQSLKVAGFTYDQINAAIYAAENDLQAGAEYSGAEMAAWSAYNCKSQWRESKSVFSVTERDGNSFTMVVNGARELSFSAVPKGENPGSAEKPKQKRPASSADTNGGNVDATAAAIAEALRGLQVTPTAAHVDESTVRAIVADEMAKVKPNAEKITVVQVGEKVSEVSGAHPMLKKVLPMVINDRISGKNVYLYGPAGTGKTTLIQQVAKVLELPYYSGSGLLQKYEVEGYRNAAGEYVPTAFYKAFTEGGVYDAAELDSWSGEALVALNNATAGCGYTFPDGNGCQKAHPNFHFIANGNTCGRGADAAYNNRFQLDASTLDRFAFVKVDYCQEVELAAANGDAELVEFLQDLRKAIAAAGLTYTATPRAARAFKAFEACQCYTVEELIELAICGGWDDANKVTLSANLNKSNKYAAVFIKRYGAK